MTREPLLTIAGATSVAAALVTLFGIPLSDEQTAALMTIVAVFAPLVVALLVRPKVTPAPPGRRRVDRQYPGEAGQANLGPVLTALLIILAVLAILWFLLELAGRT